ncbi:MAG: sirohydrochlorin cobaltochelatase [Tissierellales bacterium]|jgi:sirohydrochlorin cobaltochelatase|nr:sirohydrochlorin cobaltochelatase [Tissierellales bacterium]
MKKLAIFAMVLMLGVTSLGGASVLANETAEKAVQTIQADQQKEVKKGILVVSFGTSHADTRALTIEAAEKQIQKTFPEYDVKRAFTSKMIIKIIDKRDGVKVNTVEEAMEEFKKEGYTDIIVQPLHIMNGAEYDELVEESTPYAESFNTFEVASPLLTSVEDYKNVAKALESQLPERKEGEAVVFMGHGTHHFANSTYPAMDYVFHDLGYENVFVGTVEGYPSIEEVKKRLEENKVKKVTLMPFMLVAGDHAKNDMAGEEEDSWKSILEKAGYEVEIYLHGLGENEGIRNIYASHTQNEIDQLLAEAAELKAQEEAKAKETAEVKEVVVEVKTEEKK